MMDEVLVDCLLLLKLVAGCSNFSSWPSAKRLLLAGAGAKQQGLRRQNAFVANLRRSGGRAAAL